MKFAARLLLIAAVIPTAALAQQLSQQWLYYIAQYRQAAVQQELEYGIPASITMAQALLESEAGQSRLVIEGNNHFGIKCGKGWEGDTIRHDDDLLQECFRRYETAEESFVDHSRFLHRPRYAPLFKIDKSDYRGWALMLSRCGYATDPAYPEKLADIIERYNLQDLASTPPDSIQEPTSAEWDIFQELRH